MPWASEDLHDGGVVVDGIYRELLEHVREDCERNNRDPRRAWGDDGDEDPRFYRNPRRFLLEALEGGKAVILQRSTVEVAHEWRWRLPWDRSVKSVRVSPDDVVRPTEENHPWYGCAADDAGER